jgi:hypothetical protein
LLRGDSLLPLRELRGVEARLPSLGLDRGARVGARVRGAVSSALREKKREREGRR